MPVAKCPRCATSLSLPEEAGTQKIRCRKCGAAFQVGRSAPPPIPSAVEKVQQVELTAKKWKAIQLAGGALILLGFLVMWLSFQFPKAPALWPVSLMCLVGGILVYFVGQTLAWWHHG